jgi:hypothetical protein
LIYLIWEFIILLVLLYYHFDCFLGPIIYGFCSFIGSGRKASHGACCCWLV